MTRPAFLVFVSVRALAAAAALLGLTLAVASCGDSEEDIAQASRSPSATGSPSTPASPPVTATATPVPVPTGWQTYVDPILAFAFSYPSSLIPTDLPAANSGSKQRVTDFRPAGAKEPGLAVVVVEDVGDISLRDWVQTYSACNLDVRPGTEVAIATRPALVCVGDPRGMVAILYMGFAIFL